MELALKCETVPLEGVSVFRAYLASGLTNVAGSERAASDAAKSRIVSACERWGIEVYLPEKFTHPDDFPNVSAEDVWARDRRQALNSDLLILFADYPTTGGGMELEFAHNALMPVLVVAHSGKRVSKMILGCPVVLHRGEVVRYDNFDELEDQVRAGLARLWDRIVDRSTLGINYSANYVGERIRFLRERAGMPQEDLAERLGTTVGEIEYYETTPDGACNLSVPGLTVMARALGVTLTELVGSEELGTAGGEVYTGAQVVAARTPKKSRSHLQFEKLTAGDSLAIRKWLESRPKIGDD